MTVLSICIPVYNCGNFLPAALASILPQAGPDVEVVVYDGGSTDDTPAVMQRFASDGLRYVRAASRGGIDADLATCIANARGEYCWLFSGDDVMREGALAQAMAAVRSGSDVYLCRHTICNIGMQWIRDHPVVLPVDVARTVDLSDRHQRLAWFAAAATTEAFFSFISGILVRKASWDKGTMPVAFSRSCWAHVARLLALASAGLRVTYLPHIWLDQRGENDSFVHAGVVNRYRIAIDGYQGIGEALFGDDSVEAFHIRRVLRNEFSLQMFLNAKIHCLQDPAREDIALLGALYRRLHRDASLASIVLLLGYRLVTPRAALLLRQGLRALRRVRSAL